MDRFRIQAKAIINGNYIDQWTKSDHYQARILVELCWEELKECRDADNNLTLFTKLSNFLIYLSLRFPVELGELGRWDIGKCKDLYTPVGSRLLLLALIYGNDKFKIDDFVHRMASHITTDNHVTTVYRASITLDDLYYNVENVNTLNELKPWLKHGLERRMVSIQKLSHEQFLSLVNCEVSD